jgi:hypothetical protein
MREISRGAAFIPLTSGAFSYHRYLSICKSRMQQLLPISLPKIQVQAAFPLVEQAIGVSKALCERISHFLPDGVATGAYAGAYGCHQIFHSRSIFLPHSCDALLYDLGGCASPSGVKGCYDALLDIDNQDRNAIGRPHSQQNGWLIGYQAVSFEDCFSLGGLKLFLQRSILFLYQTHGCGVYLAERYES